MDRTFITKSPLETRELAALLLDEFPAPRVFALYGDLGSGKTCFVQGLATALGIRRIVSSPTFTVINEYPGTSPLYHVDLYRLADALEALNIGLEEYLESRGVTAIEWAERAEELLPAHTVRLVFKTGPEPGRRLISLSMPPGMSPGTNQ